MIAQIIREARDKIPRSPSNRQQPSFPAHLRLDGEDWFSATPTNSGHAESINQQMREMVSRLK